MCLQNNIIKEYIGQCIYHIVSVRVSQYLIVCNCVPAFCLLVRNKHGCYCRLNKQCLFTNLFFVCCTVISLHSGQLIESLFYLTWVIINYIIYSCCHFYQVQVILCLLCLLSNLQYSRICYMYLVIFVCSIQISMVDGLLFLASCSNIIVYRVTLILIMYLLVISI